MNGQEKNNSSGHMPLEDDELQLSLYMQRISTFKRVSRILATIIVILGVIAALGWFLNLPLLRGEFLGYPGTKLQSAFIFIMAGFCIYLLNIKLNPQKMIIPKVLALVVTIWAALTLLEYITGINLGMNQLFNSVLPGNYSVLSKSRILSSLNFVLLGTALLMASYKYKIRWMQFITLTSGFIGLIGFSTYFYGINTAHALDFIVEMALLTSVMNIFLSASILCIYPDRYYMGRITAQNSGGFMARRLIPVTLGTVFIIGFLIRRGEQLNLYSDHLGDILITLITMAFLTTVIFWNAKILNRIDRQRQESNRKQLNIKQFYENLVEGINEGMWVTDENDRLYFMNRGMEEITGVKTEKMNGLHILDDLPDETTGQLKESYLQAKETLKPVFYDTIPVSSPTGKESYQSGWIIPQIKENEFNGAICTVIDETRRKKAEKALSKSETYYRTIFENTGTATIIVNADRIITKANKKCEELTGFKVDEIENKINWTDFVHQDDLELMKNYHQMRREKTANVPSEYEFSMANQNNNKKQIMLSASIIPGTTDSVVSLLDITERKKSEVKIQQSLKEKELLLREIHHRVKNNMQIISSLLNLQRSYIKDKDTDNLLKESQGRVRSMALVHEKLYQTDDLARISAAKYIKNLTMNLFHSYSMQPGINLNVDVGEVFFDIDTAIPLGLIINELVSNSLKYAFFNQEKGEINISLHEESDDGKYHLIVRDDGVGFPKDLDFHNTPSLGLQLVNTLVKQLDGTIELIENKGTCFQVIFQQQKYKERV